MGGGVGGGRLDRDLQGVEILGDAGADDELAQRLARR